MLSGAQTVNPRGLFTPAGESYFDHPLEALDQTESGTAGDSYGVSRVPSLWGSMSGSGVRAFSANGPSSEDPYGPLDPYNNYSFSRRQEIESVLRDLYNKLMDGKGTNEDFARARNGYLAIKEYASPVLNFIHVKLFRRDYLEVITKQFTAFLNERDDRSFGQMAAAFEADVESSRLTTAEDIIARVEADIQELGPNVFSRFYLNKVSSSLGVLSQQLPLNEYIKILIRIVEFGDRDGVKREEHIPGLISLLDGVERRLFGAREATPEIQPLVTRLYARVSDFFTTKESSRPAYLAGYIMYERVENGFNSDPLGDTWDVEANRIADAVVYASLAHGPQLRKGTDLPYIIHPLKAAIIVAQHGGSIDQIIAALLHDVPEDTPVTLDQIREKFGDRIANAVQGAVRPGSNGEEKLPWEQGKQFTIDSIATLPEDALIVELADKIDNIRAIRADYEALGEGVWTRFKRGRESQAWYYGSLAKAFLDRANSSVEDLHDWQRRMAGEFARNVAAVFGDNTPSSAPSGSGAAPLSGGTPSFGALMTAFPTAVALLELGTYTAYGYPITGADSGSITAANEDVIGNERYEMFDGYEYMEMTEACYYDYLAAVFDDLDIGVFDFNPDLVPY